SKSYLDDILSSMIDSLIVIDIEGNIQKVNQATLRLLGYQESELINKSIKLILPDQSLTIESSICNYFIGSCETTYLSKEGKKIPVAFSSSCILNDEKKAQGVVCVARNITEKQLAEKALRESEERYALASRAANDGLWDWNLTTNQIYFSPRWKSLLGYEDDEIDNSPEEWFTRVHPEYTDQLTREIITHLQNDISHFEISYPMEYNDGSYRWMLCRGIAVQDQEGKVYRLTGSQTDITLSRLVEEQLRYDALHDKLTGLPNRAFFLEELEELLETSKHEQDSMFTVLFLDLDRFKFINDSLGHLVGDELLIEFAHRIQTCLSSENTFARLGGDEFVIILKNIKNISDATQLAENIQKKLKKPFQLQGNEIFVSVSIGIAQSTSNYEQIEDILRDADTAMYQAKASGKARYALFEPGMHQKVLKTLALENDLRRALEQGEFELLYQPIVKLSNRQIMGFEALLRWQHPTKGFVSPEQFISLAEETGVIVPIGWWVMREAARQMRRWQERYPLHSSMTISVNVSAKQLDEINQVLNQIEKILEQTGLPPSCLKLEITESIIMNNTEQVAFMLKQLKALGIRLSMDDFGTGYSSLSYLHQLPIDTLKIDRSFVRNIDVDSEKFELAQTIVNLAKNLKMEAIAEGIETSKQLAKLEQLNCKYGQGYFFSKPMTSERAEALISSEQQVIQWWTRE
ncbi:MAG: EAL domain-containing protein, partial [Prochloraceae cyanobacterium]